MLLQKVSRSTFGSLIDSLEERALPALRFENSEFSTDFVAVSYAFDRHPLSLTPTTFLRTHEIIYSTNPEANPSVKDDILAFEKGFQARVKQLELNFKSGRNPKGWADFKYAMIAVVSHDQVFKREHDSDPYFLSLILGAQTPYNDSQLYELDSHLVQGLASAPNLPRIFSVHASYPIGGFEGRGMDEYFVNMRGLKRVANSPYQYANPKMVESEVFEAQKVSS